LQRDQPVLLPADFDAVQNRQIGFAAGDFVEAGQRDFEFRPGQCDFGIHVIFLWLLVKCAGRPHAERMAGRL
jgi:hypothetical protein